MNASHLTKQLMMVFTLSQWAAARSFFCSTHHRHRWSMDWQLLRTVGQMLQMRWDWFFCTPFVLLSQVNTITVLLWLCTWDKKNGQKAFSPHLQHLTSILYFKGQQTFIHRPMIYLLYCMHTVGCWLFFTESTSLQHRWSMDCWQLLRTELYFKGQQTFIHRPMIYLYCWMHCTHACAWTG